jgi:hypothetical protein
MFLVFFDVTLELYYRAFPTCVSRGWTVPSFLSAASIMVLLLSLNIISAVNKAIEMFLNAMETFLHAIEEAARRRFKSVIATWTLGGDSAEPITEGPDIYPPPYHDIVS